MLDAYIIDRIRREQERARQDDVRVPLHIDHPRAPSVPPPPDHSKEEPERGSVVIDFHV